MLHSLFLINSSGDVLISKHFRGLINRSVCDQFIDQVTKAENPDDVVPIIQTPKYFMVHVYRNGLYLLGLLTQEFSPLMVLEFLHRVCDVCEQYFGKFNETVFRDNFVTVYQIIDEMMDSGFPFTTEPNTLMEMIPPPSLMQKWSGITGGGNMKSNLPDGTLSNTPWRKTGVKYTTNEIYFDIIEEVECVCDANGVSNNCEVIGEIQTLSKLSGMPDLTLIFNNPHLLDDVSFHPCVRYTRFEQTKQLSFVPPDGQFKLMGYRVKGQMQLPLFVKPQINFHTGTGRVNVTVTSRIPGKAIEEVVITIPFPKIVSGNNLSSNVGAVQFNDMTKVLTWTIGKIPKEKTPILEGTVSYDSNAPLPDANPILKVDFRVSMQTISGLKVDSLNLYNEKYKPYKGVRSISKGGKYHVKS